MFVVQHNGENISDVMHKRLSLVLILIITNHKTQAQQPSESSFET